MCTLVYMIDCHLLSIAHLCIFLYKNTFIHFNSLRSVQAACCALSNNHHQQSQTEELQNVAVSIEDFHLRCVCLLTNCLTTYRSRDEWCTEYKSCVYH